jgi:Icc-related predicted phosphoesterase
MDKSTHTHLGCRELLKSVSTIVQPKLHLFGHVHGGYGQLKTDDELGRTLFVNASLCDHKYRIVHSPIVIDLTKNG